MDVSSLLSGNCTSWAVDSGMDSGLDLWTGLWTGLVDWTLDWTVDWTLDWICGLRFGLVTVLQLHNLGSFPERKHVHRESLVSFLT